MKQTEKTAKNETEPMEQAILRAAERLFLDKGFALTSTTEIAREAGCNQALVHYYFRTKENLFEKIFEQKIRMLISNIFSIDREGGTFEEKLRRKIEAHFEILKKNPKIPFLVINEITTNPERIASLRDSIGELPLSVYATFEQDLQKEIAQGRVRETNALDLMFSALSLNLATFLVRPVLQNILGLTDEAMDGFLEHRKEENVKIILQSLKPSLMHKFSKTMKIIRSILLLAVGFGTLPAQAQLTIDACQQKAQANYPLVAQYGLIRQSEQYDLENANKGYLPQLSLSAKASYQTDVTKIPFSLPGIDIPTLSKDQYQVVAEVNQVIWDGGNIRAKKQNVKASAEVDLQQQQVDMYAIRERVNSLFFGILLTEEQLELNRLYDEELERNYRKISSFIENGVANQADLDAVQVEQLSNRQQRVSLEATNRAYRQMLGAFIGENADSAELICPEVGSEPAPTDVNRPELRLLDARNTLLDAQLKQLNARNRPTLGLFVQGAYGKPGLNMLQDKFKAFAIGGVRFSWNFGNYYTHKSDAAKIDVARNALRTQRETFLFNTNQQVESSQSELEKYRRTLSDDDRIVALRDNIKRASEAKVAEGTMSVTDYMQEVTKAETARQNRALHRMQLIMTTYNLKNITNN